MPKVNNEEMVGIKGDKTVSNILNMDWVQIFHDFYVEYDKFIDEQKMLLDSLYCDYDADVNDIIRLNSVCDSIIFIMGMIFHIKDFCKLICIMDSEKDGFEIQKKLEENAVYLQEKLESEIKICRTWKFKDYRCIDWVKRVTKWMEKIKEEMFEE